GKDDCLVVDLCDVTASVGKLITIVDLRIPNLLDAETGEEMRPLVEEEEKPVPPPVDEYGRIDWHAVEVDLFTGDIRWQFVAGSRLLDLGGGRTVVVWAVNGDGRHRAILADVKAKRVEQLTWGAVPEPEALEAAERCARRCGPDARMVARSAWWDRPDNFATAKQRKTLSSFGFEEALTCHWTRGKASRTLTWCFARACYAAHLSGGAWPSRGQLSGYARAYQLRGGVLGG
ncbi:MAG: hypothetical protein ABIL09_04455, partial [Gemmatimonadota bacterium]